MKQTPNKNKTKISKSHDLEERTIKFSEDVIDLVNGIRKNEINRSLISQLVRAGTSIGANYCEANAASSKKDFRNKIYISKKEANETKYWLRIVSKAQPSVKEKARTLWKEAHEFHLIFQKVTSTLDKNEK